MVLWVVWGCLAGFVRFILVRLRFKLAAGLGGPWCWDGGIPQGCPLSMVIIVALYVPWCRRLESPCSACRAGSLPRRGAKTVSYGPDGRRTFGIPSC